MIDAYIDRTRQSFPAFLLLIALPILALIYLLVRDVVVACWIGTALFLGLMIAGVGRR